jgi:hypothetical protein
MCTRSKIFNSTVLFLLTTGLILLPGMLQAQDESCQGQDPTGSSTTCPLDTWVWLLVAAAAIAGAIILSKRQNLNRCSSISSN